MLKRVYKISLITSVLLFAFGLLLVFNAEMFIKSITTILGVILLIVGLLPVIDFFRYRKDGMFAGIGLISGIFSVVCGLMLLLNDNMLMVLIPVFVGVWMIINGINKIQISFDIRDTDEKSWIITFIFALVVIVAGAYLIINPVSGAELVTQTLGVIICIYAVLDIVDCILIKIKFNKAKKIANSDSKIVSEQ